MQVHQPRPEDTRLNEADERELAVGLEDEAGADLEGARAIVLKGDETEV